MSPNGIIRKLNFILEIPNKNIFEGLCNDLSSFTQKKLNQAILEVLEGFDVEGDYQLDSIKIDVGKFSTNSLNDDLIEKLKSSLKTEIKKSLTSTQENRTTRKRDLLIFFIEKGYFPWWNSNKEDVFKALDQIQPKSKFASDLFYLLLEDKEKFYRIHNLLKEKKIPLLFEKLLAVDQTFLSIKHAFFQDLFKKVQSRSAQSSYALKEMNYYFFKRYPNLKNDHAKLFHQLFLKFSELHNLDVEHSYYLAKGLLEETANYQKTAIKHYLEITPEALTQIDPSEEITTIGITETILNYLEAGEINFGEVTVTTNTLTTYFKQALKIDSKVIVELLQSTDFNNSPIKLLRLSRILDPSNRKFILNLIYPKELSNFILEVYELLLNSNFINALNRKVFSGSSNDISLQFYSFFLKKNRRIESKKEVFKAFITKLSTSYKIDSQLFIIDFYQSTVGTTQLNTIKGIFRELFTETYSQMVQLSTIKYDKLATDELANATRYYTLNFFQQNLLNYLFQRFLKVSDNNRMVLSKKNLIDFLAKNIKSEQKEEVAKIIKKTVITFTKDFGLDFKTTFNSLWTIINQNEVKTNWDYQFLSTFSEQLTTVKEKFQVPDKTNFNYFQNTLFDYLTSLFFSMRKDSEMGNFLSKGKVFDTILIAAIIEEKGEDHLRIIEHVINQISLRTNLSYEKLRLRILDQIALKEIPSAFDTSILFVYVDELLKDPVKRSEALLKIINFEPLIDKLIAGRDQDRARLKKILSYPEVFKKLKERSKGETDDSFVATAPKGAQKILTQTRDGNSLNYFQKNVLDFFINRTKQFNTNPKDTAVFSPERIIPLIANYLKKESTEDTTQIFSKLVDLLSKDTHYSYTVMVDKLFQQIKQQGDKTQMDYRFLSTFKAPSLVEAIDNKEKQAPLRSPNIAALNYFQRSIFDYLAGLFLQLKKDSNLSGNFPKEAELNSFLITAIKELKGENHLQILNRLLEQFSTRINIPYKTIRSKIMEQLALKTTLLNFDTALLFYYLDELLKQPETRVVELNKIKYFENLIDQLITAREQDKPLFKKILSYPEVFDKLKETSKQDTVNSFLQEVNVDNKESLLINVANYNLNYFQKSILEFILSRTKNLQKDPTYADVFSLERILPLLAEFLKKEVDEDYKRIFSKLVERIAADFKHSYTTVVQQILKAIISTSDKTQLDYHFLALFKTQESEELADQKEDLFALRSIPVLELNYFQRSLFDYLVNLLLTQKKETNLDRLIQNEEELTHFLIEAIKKLKGEDYTKHLDFLLKEFSILINLPYQDLRFIILEYLALKNSLSRFDSTLLFLYLDELLINQATRIAELEKIKNIQPLIEKLIENRITNQTLFKKILSYPEVFDKLKATASSATAERLLSNFPPEEQRELLQTLDTKELNFFQKSILEFIIDTLHQLNTDIDQEIRISITQITPILVAALAEEKTEDYERIFSRILELLSQETEYNFSVWVNKLLRVITQNESKSQLDYRFLSVFTPQLQEEITIAKQNLPSSSTSIGLNYFQRSLYDYLNELLYLLQKDPLFTAIFPKEEDLLAFVLDEIRESKGEDYTRIIPAILDQFSTLVKLDFDVFRLKVLEVLSKKTTTSRFDNALMFYYLNIFLKEEDTRTEELAKIKNIESLLEKLIENRTEDRSLFKKILSYPEVLEQIKETTFTKILKYLAPEKQVDYKKLLKRILEVTPKNRVTEIVSKLRMYGALTILEHPEKISSEQFINEIIERLIVHDPELFSTHFKKSGLKNTVQEILKSQSTTFSINEIINKLTEGDFLNKQLSYNDPEINQFEYLLQLKNEIERAEEIIETDTTVSFEGIEDILKDEKLLRQFLNKNTDDIELFVAFSELSLNKQYDSILKERLEVIDRELISFEKKIKQLQQSVNFSNLPQKSFLAALRTFILRKIALNKTFDFEALIFDFLTLLLKEKFLNLNRLVEIRKLKSTDSLDGKIQAGVALFLEGNKFAGIRTKIKEQLYLKDLFFYQLKYNEPPPWATSKKIDFKQIVAFVIERIEAEDKSYLDKLFQEQTIVSALSKALKSEPLIFQIKVLNLIQSKGIPFQIGILYKNTLDYVFSLPIPDKEKISTLLFQFFLTERLGAISSQLVLAEKIFEVLKGKVNTNLKKLFSAINKETPVSESLITLKRQAPFKTNDKIEIITYYLIHGTVPESLRIYKTTVLNEIKTFLKEASTLKMILSYLELNQKNAALLLDLTDKKSLNKNLRTNYFSQEIKMEEIGDILLEEVDKMSPKDYFKLLATLSKTLSIPGAKKTNYVTFFNSIRTEFSAVFKTIETYIKDNFTVEDLAPKSILQAFLILQGKTISFVETPLENKLSSFEVLRYYIEFGSLNFENTAITFSDLTSLLETLIKTEQFKVKKLVYDSAKYSIKLERILNLYNEKQQPELLNLIHPELLSKLELFKVLLKKYLKLSLTDSIQLNSDQELTPYLLNFWTTKNLIVDHPVRLLENLVSEVLLKTTYSVETFFNDLTTAAEKASNSEEIKFIGELANIFFQKQSQKKRVNEEPAQVEEIKEDDAIYIENAGLVILWPFLGHLFNKLELLEDPKKFKDEQALQKAILLTQYLITGDNEISENQLVLNKLICGAEINQFVDVSIPIEDTEKELCISLLENAVLKNWPSLNKSSVDGLRETFLIREGVLKKNEKDYILIVKDKTVDILLKDITWTISIVQTGLMENKIIVEWL